MLSEEHNSNQEDKINDGNVLPIIFIILTFCLEMIKEIDRDNMFDVNDHWNLSPVLMKLLKHENNKLASSAVHLLVRIQQSQK